MDGERVFSISPPEQAEFDSLNPKRCFWGSDADECNQRGMSREALGKGMAPPEGILNSQTFLFPPQPCLGVQSPGLTWPRPRRSPTKLRVCAMYRANFSWYLHCNKPTCACRAPSPGSWRRPEADLQVRMAPLSCVSPLQQVLVAGCLSSPPPPQPSGQCLSQALAGPKTQRWTRAATSRSRPEWPQPRSL